MAIVRWADHAEIAERNAAAKARSFKMLTHPWVCWSLKSNAIFLVVEERMDSSKVSKSLATRCHFTSNDELIDSRRQPQNAVDSLAADGQTLRNVSNDNGK
jgi:hypothetical protein